MAGCLPLMLGFVTEPALYGSFMLEGSALVGLGRPSEGADAGGNRLFGGSLRDSHLALRRRKPPVNCGDARFVLVPPRCPIADPRADSVEALPDLF